MKIKCDCGKIATWFYMPDGEVPEQDRAKCDNCVPRGCICNQIPKDDNPENSDPNNWEEILDEQGRKLPCCEWMYDGYGWEEDEDNNCRK
jgi:hypothetical protein